MYLLDWINPKFLWGTYGATTTNTTYLSCCIRHPSRWKLIRLAATWLWHTGHGTKRDNRTLKRRQKHWFCQDKSSCKNLFLQSFYSLKSSSKGLYYIPCVTWLNRCFNWATKTWNNLKTYQYYLYLEFLPYNGWESWHLKVLLLRLWRP